MFAFIKYTLVAWPRKMLGAKVDLQLLWGEGMGGFDFLVAVCRVLAGATCREVADNRDWE